MFGLTNMVSRLHLSPPAPMVLQRRFAAAGWLALAAEHGAQSSAVVPSMLQLLLREDRRGVRPVAAALRHLAAARRSPTRCARRSRQRVPGVVVCDGYGCTEATSTATMNPPTARRPGTVGRSVPGAEVGVVDDDGQRLPAGDDGEVCVRAPGVMAGYWRDPAATAEAVVDGLLRTGDIGHLDDDGYLTIVDRKKDLVIRGGFNVYPRDVEDVLLAHPAVSAAARRRAPRRRPTARRSSPSSRCAPARPPAPSELLAHAAAGLAAHKRPRELHVVDAVPLTSVGKTDRKASCGATLLRSIVLDRPASDRPLCSPVPDGRSARARRQPGGASPSSSGPGLHPFKVATRVRIPLGAQHHGSVSTTRPRSAVG